ncbi:MAG: sigma-70 family RNA polymerase sigma factor [Clostridia bacterium]|nr:sigma-70 family RNA polymerase sigma factor [Clostridia bacterium]
MLEDSKIIDLFFERSEQALTELSDKYEKLCKKISINILGSEEDALECINDSYLGVWNTIPPQKPDNLKFYLLRIVRNNAIKRFNRNTAKKRNSFYDVALQELEGCLPSEDTIEKTLLCNEISDLLNSFLQSQNKVNRIIFVRRYYFSDSIGEIARRVNLTENNISVRLNRMRKSLKNHLEKEGIKI